MNSYLQTLNNLKIDHSDSQVYHQASKYSTYQDFLHRRSKLRSLTTQSYIPQKRIKTQIDGNLQNYSQLKNKSQTVYYPVHRTQIQYHDRQYVEKIPKTKKVVEYIEKKEVEIIPREVKKTDYYAVEHLRTYYKQVVPEVRVQTIQVPKVIKNVQYVPVQKQIIFYPSYLSDMSQIKEQARKNLERQGVIIRENAQYRPLQTKMNTVEIKSNALSQQLKYKIEQAQSKLQRIQKMEMNQQIRQRNGPLFFTLSRPKNHSKEFRNSISNNTNKRVSWGNIPVYQKQKYESGVYKSYLSGKIGSASTIYQPRDSVFHQKDQYRYNMALNTSANFKI